MKTKSWIYLGLATVLLIGFWFYSTKASYEIKNLGFDDAPAKVIIKEYADFQCPACGAAYPTVNNLKKKYNREQVRWDYKHFPLTQIHPYAFKAAQAAECARDQEKFEEYHNKLFENQENLHVSSLKHYASELGLNNKDFNACLDSNAMVPRINGNLEEGTRAGVRATPTFFINNQKHEGVLNEEEFIQLIDAQLKK